MKKLEAKLLAATREKTGMAANMASQERQLGELKKTNEFLKNKVRVTDDHLALTLQYQYVNLMFLLLN